MIAALAAVMLNGAAQAQTPSSYPAALDREGLSAWLREVTDLPPEQVVAVSASAATAIVARTPAANGRTEARLRAVAITPQAAARSGVLAWEMRLEIDCRSGQVRIGATTGYATRRAAPEGLPLAAADPVWRRPKSNTTLDASWRAVCDAKFQPPLSAGPFRVAEAPTVQPAAPSAAATAPIVTRSVARDTQASAAPPRLTPANLPVSSPRLQSRTSAKAPAPPAEAKAIKAKQGKAKQGGSTQAAPGRSPVKTGGRAGVQVLSTPVEAEARQKLLRLQRRYGATAPGIETRIVPAQVRGRTVYRGVIAGFATRGDARAFCQTLKQGGHTCLTL